MNFGTSEHAAAVTEGRHPAVRDGLQWLTYAHLPEQLRRFSKPFFTTAVELVSEVTTDSPELTTAINRLIEAKDSAVRAGIRHATGRAGSVPRPQAVAEPPKLSGRAHVCSRGVEFGSPAWGPDGHLCGDMPSEPAAGQR